MVVDDGSADPSAIAAVAAAHGAALIRRPASGGPGAPRNTGLGGSRPATWSPSWTATACPGRAGSSGSPRTSPTRLVAAAARHDILAGGAELGRPVHHRAALPGPRRPRARVVPGTRVAYVPTAALLVRRARPAPIAPAGAVFDPALRWGEDVDLIWRLHDAGWRIRYDPAIRVAHHEPRTWPALLARRFRYGTSAAPLARAAPRPACAPLVLHPWPALTVAGLVAGLPAVAALGFAGSVLAMRRPLRRAGLPARGACPRYARRDPADLAGHWAVTRASSALPCSPPRCWRRAGVGRARRWRPARRRPRRCCSAPPLTTWSSRRPELDPVRFTCSVIWRDDMAYGAGV